MRQKLNKNLYQWTYQWIPIVLYAYYHEISRFFTTGQRFEILSVKTTKRAILTYFRVPLDIKQQYLKSKYFIDVLENSFLFDSKLPLVFSSIKTRVITKKLRPYLFIHVYFIIRYNHVVLVFCYKSSYNWAKNKW